MTALGLRLLLSYMALSILAGFVGTAAGYGSFAATWLYTPPIFLVLLGGVSLFIAFVWWG